MPITKRAWSHKVLRIQDLPKEILEAPIYQSEDWWLDAANISENLRYIGIWFEDGAWHLWRKRPGEACYSLIRKHSTHTNFNVE